MAEDRDDGDELRSDARPILALIEKQVAALQTLLSSRSAGPSGQADPAGSDEARDLGAHGGLTPRESEVLGRLSMGESNIVIARFLGISVRTVKAHLRSIFRKMNVSGRAEVIVRVLSKRPPEDDP